MQKTIIQAVRSRLPNGQFAPETPKKDRITILEARGRGQSGIISDLRTMNASQFEEIRQLRNQNESQLETIQQLQQRVLGHSISWFTIGVLSAAVGFLITQYVL